MTKKYEIVEKFRQLSAINPDVTPREKGLFCSTCDLQLKKCTLQFLKKHVESSTHIENKKPKTKEILPQSN